MNLKSILSVALIAGALAGCGSERISFERPYQDGTRISKGEPIHACYPSSGTTASNKKAIDKNRSSASRKAFPNNVEYSHSYQWGGEYCSVFNVD